MIVGDGVVGRKIRSRATRRAFNGEGALAVLKSADFGRGMECFGLNKGQFSAIDLLDAILHFTGPARVVIATWTAAHADVRRAEQFIRTGRAASMLWLVDRSFQTRQPAYCALLRETFGDDVIRVTSSHAKFMLIEAGEWRVVVQTSMNLNQNARLESFWVADDSALYEAYSGVVAECFGLQGPGEGFAEGARGRRDMSRLGAEGRSSFYDVRPAIEVLL